LLRLFGESSGESCSAPRNSAPRGLQIGFAKVLEYLPDEKRLMVRAGFGWVPDIVGVPLASDIGSPAGYAYQTGEILILNHLEAETRFRTPQILADHGIKRAINVLIEKGGEGKAFFGVFGGSAILSVTDRCLKRGGDGITIRLRFANLVVSIAHFQKFDDVV
jgi:hypothetical protein